MITFTSPDTAVSSDHHKLCSLRVSALFHQRDCFLLVLASVVFDGSSTSSPPTGPTCLLECLFTF